VKRISMVGVVASTAGSILAATTVIFSASLAVAGPTDGGLSDAYQVRGIDRSGLDLPVTVPVYASKGQTTKLVGLAPPDLRMPTALPEGTPPADDPRDEPPPVFFGEEIDADTNSVIYVIDNSGSMSLTVEPFQDEGGNVVSAGNRLDRAKTELRRSIATLPESFYFNVIFYDECTMACWPSKKQATAANKASAFSWISTVQPDGWTNTGLAVAEALRDKQNTSVVLLSDGSPNFLDCGMVYVGTFEQHRDLIRNSNSQGATVNAFGIGLSADRDARSFMQAVAAENGGSYVEIN
jgi:hypothetical protein